MTLNNWLLYIVYLQMGFTSAIKLDSLRRIMCAEKMYYKTDVGDMRVIRTNELKSVLQLGKPAALSGCWGLPVLLTVARLGSRSSYNLI